MNSITSREKSLLVFVLIIAIVFCGISFAIIPLTQEIEINNANASGVSSQKVAMQEVVNSQISEQEMSQAIVEARDYYGELYNNEKLLRSDIHEIITEKTLFKHNLRLIDYTPGESSSSVSQFQSNAADSEENPNVVQLRYYNISVEATGTYTNILSYLDELKGLSSCLQVSTVSISIINNPENTALFGGDGQRAYLTISKDIYCKANLEIRLYEIDKNIDAILNSYSNPSDDEITTETGDDQ